MPKEHNNGATLPRPPRVSDAINDAAGAPREGEVTPRAKWQLSAPSWSSTDVIEDLAAGASFAAPNLFKRMDEPTFVEMVADWTFVPYGSIADTSGKWYFVDRATGVNQEGNRIVVALENERPVTVAQFADEAIDKARRFRCALAAYIAEARGLTPK